MEQSENSMIKYTEAESELRYFAHQQFPEATLTMLDAATIRATAPEGAQLSYFGEKEPSFDLGYDSTCGGIFMVGRDHDLEPGRIEELNQKMDFIQSYIDHLGEAARGSGYDEMSDSKRMEEIARGSKSVEQIAQEIEAIKSSYLPNKEVSPQALDLEKHRDNIPPAEQPKQPLRHSIRDKLAAAKAKCAQQVAEAPAKQKDRTHETER